MQVEDIPIVAYLHIIIGSRHHIYICILPVRPDVAKGVCLRRALSRLTVPIAHLPPLDSDSQCTDTQLTQFHV